MPLMVQLLIGLGTEIAQRRVPSAPVVEGLNVEEQVRLRLVAGLVDSMVYQLTFQRAEKAFHGRIIIPSPDSIHVFDILSRPQSCG